MTTDFRALCVELTDCLEKADWPHRYKAVFQQWMDIAHAALAEADGPAVPEGREPASVAWEPSDEEIMGLMPQQMHDDLAAAVRAMAEQEGIDSTPAKKEKNVNKEAKSMSHSKFVSLLHYEAREADLDLMTAEQCHRAALAEPEPEGPTVMEIIDLADEIEAAELGQVDLVRAALARWGHQPAPPAAGEQRHPTPVPVSERLPGPKDCDAEGRCWFSIDGAQWALEDRIYGCDRYRSHWLPAHALPLPAGEVGK